ncbi:Dihydroorotate dehydrogenase, electron transfer subunit protein [Pseudodesulfovibrio mercurii]|uniref:Dihydroorotate dehydrogenase B (NAD(+)), electron transfer subunit n=1 Tax=Pseudodesulfovibrio mercurii TaxID=641491 RepID=F0JJ95_9BACT|nr:dihydroorotate dehydrogenase electron transfer subunit [Pseudodesulfovibrio mercurii]EGB15994.1 Dihydroorotate dehydrogenase, electron transfer subunit protein [Pseudodesulfovibrio mercurii]
MCQESKTGRTHCTILSNEPLAEGVRELIFESPAMAASARPGQFVSVYCRHQGQLLPRPISICEIDRDNGRLHLVYACRGKGTREFADYRPGERVDVMGPLGNGFPLGAAGETNLIIGGGVGTPPLVELCKQLPGRKVVAVSFRSDPYLIERLALYGEVLVATRDGSVGVRGNAMKIVEDRGLTGTIFACGPTPMLRAVQAYAARRELPAYLSLEERMGCGFGCCVGCVTKIRDDGEAGFSYRKVCKDGPVFAAEEVIFS